MSWFVLILPTFGILQCKEQSDGMLEKACITVESAAKGGGVYPEVLFDVARQWYSLYQKVGHQLCRSFYRNRSEVKQWKIDFIRSICHWTLTF